MSETIYPESKSELSWPTGGAATPVPNTSMLPGSEKPPSPAIRLLKQAVQGAHDAVDRLAGLAAPAAQRLGDTYSATEEALHAKRGEISETGEEWVDEMRSTVRENPLVAVAAAVALGVVISRISR